MKGLSLKGKEINQKKMKNEWKPPRDPPEKDMTVPVDIDIDNLKGIHPVTRKKFSSKELQKLLIKTFLLNEQFEQYDRLVKVRKAYLEMTEVDTGNFIFIDARQSIELVVAEVHNHIEKSIRERQKEPS